jgi:hypothetical protein
VAYSTCEELYTLENVRINGVYYLKDGIFGNQTRKTYCHLAGTYTGYAPDIYHIQMSQTRTCIVNIFLFVVFQFSWYSWIGLSHTTAGAWHGNPVWDKARHVMKDKSVRHHVTSLSFSRLWYVYIVLNMNLFRKSLLFTVYNNVINQ